MHGARRQQAVFEVQQHAGNVEDRIAAGVEAAGLDIEHDRQKTAKPRGERIRSWQGVLLEATLTGSRSPRSCR
jgi:hypothetical protein